MENVRTVKISIEVDTNKRTISKSFGSITEMEDWLESNEDIAEMVGYFDLDDIDDEADP